MSSRTLARNAFSGTIQVLVTAAISFELYRFLNRHLTVSQIGTWSVVLASATTGRLIDLGLGGGLVRFVAKHMGTNARAQAAATIQMAMLGMLLVFGCVSLVLFPMLRAGMALLIKDPASLDQARALLPYALTTLIFSALSGAALSALDGCQRMDLRALVGTSGSAVQLIIAYCLVPSLGISGLAVAQVVQSLVVLALGVFFLLQLIGPDLYGFGGWRRSVFKELISYGGGFQAATIGQLLFEPVVKVILTRFSGLEFTGYYEMANQLILQLRGILVSAYQSLVPYVAGASRSDTELRQIYVSSYRLFFFLCCVCFGSVGLALPVVLQVWLGHYSSVFLEIAELCLVGWALPTVACPSYYMFLGMGELKWPIVSHITMGLLSAGLGIVFGRLFGGFGVLGAVTFVLIFTSHIVSYAFHRRFRIPLEWLVPSESVAIAACALVGPLSVLGLAIFTSARLDAITTGVIVGLAAALGYLSLRNSNAELAVQLLRKLREPNGGIKTPG
jgi:O-antigen/teichoic acid export membrane protein